MGGGAVAWGGVPRSCPRERNWEKSQAAHITQGAKNFFIPVLWRRCQSSQRQVAPHQRTWAPESFKGTFVGKLKWEQRQPVQVECAAVRWDIGEDRRHGEGKSWWVSPLVVWKVHQVRSQGSMWVINASGCHTPSLNSFLPHLPLAAVFGLWCECTYFSICLNLQFFSWTPCKGQQQVLFPRVLRMKQILKPSFPGPLMPKDPCKAI